MKPCVVIPTFDTPRTVEDVVRGVLEHCRDVFVVDDGSAAPTAEALSRAASLPGVVILRHDRNRGKGAALATGFRAARARGFTHAVTLDSDGQHVPQDIPRFLGAVRERPGTLFLGNRDLRAAGARAASVWGRRNSNFWVWLETGLRIPDTQTGFRAYPLGEICALHLKTAGYDFEVEVLVKAAWAGVPIDSIPIEVRYFTGSERVSHLRPIADFARIGRLNTRLLTARICLPAPYLRLRSLARFHEMRFTRRWRETFLELFVREPGPPRRVALSVGLGLFMGIAPFWGFQIALTLVLAHWLGLSKPIAVVASHISFPLMVPPILYGSLVLGRWALGTEGDGRPLGTLELAPEDVPAWIAGSFLLAAIVAVAGGLTILLVLSLWRRFAGKG